MTQAIVLNGARAAGRVALVDDADAVAVAGYSWYARTAPGTRVIYAVAYVRGTGRAAQRTIAMHTLLTGWPRVDHRNNDGLDNTRANLRPATQAQNSRNTRPHLGSSSRYKGVYWDRAHKKWRAEISKRFLGYFINEQDAARAYDTAAVEAHGSYARLNFPPS